MGRRGQREIVDMERLLRRPLSLRPRTIALDRADDGPRVANLVATCLKSPPSPRPSHVGDYANLIAKRVSDIAARDNNAA